MTDYDDIFGKRAHLYQRANAAHPAARDAERALLIDLLELAPGMTLCDVPAGGGYVAEGVRARFGTSITITCLEPTTTFFAFIDPRFDPRLSSLERLDLPDASVDRVACLAALHHIDDKPAFFREIHRVLKPHGRVAAGDVLAGTAPAHFLDDTVDRFSSTGHRGSFVAPGELTTLLAAAGFGTPNVIHHSVPWRFPDLPTELDYVRDIFGMDGVDDATLTAELIRYFGQAVVGPDPVIPWELTYATTERP